MTRLGNDLAGMTIAELLRLSGGALAELRLRGIVRTGNAPAGDLAERLVSEATGGMLAPNSEKSWDVRLPPTRNGEEGARIQVKARVVADTKNLGQRQASAFRSWDCEAVMLVLFDPLFPSAGGIPGASRDRASVCEASRLHGVGARACDQRPAPIGITVGGAASPDRSLGRRAPRAGSRVGDGV
jgi:hypothetical protein